MAHWKDIAYISLEYDIPKVRAIEEKHKGDPKNAAKNYLKSGCAHTEQVIQKPGKIC